MDQISDQKVAGAEIFLFIAIPSAVTGALCFYLGSVVGMAALLMMIAASLAFFRISMKLGAFLHSKGAKFCIRILDHLHRVENPGHKCEDHAA